jgi:Zn/Cd-binding protein ZinT
MKLTNDNQQAITITEDTVTIRDNGKTYKFQYAGVSVLDATSSEHYTYIRFNVGNASAYEGSREYFQYLSIGYNEVHNSIVFTAVYIKELKKANKAIRIHGSFKCNVVEWLRNLQIGT